MATPSSNHQTPIPAFSGENYNYWAIKMRTYFMSQSLWDIVDKGYTIPEDLSALSTADRAKFNKEMEKDYLALYSLQMAMAESIFQESVELKHQRRLGILLRKNVMGVRSGCSNHMTGDEKQFRDIDRTIKSQVKLGNGELVDVEGKGTIAVNTNKGTRLIKDVMLVPKLDANLLSVGQMMDKGYSLIFKDDSCKIYDNKNIDLVVAEVKMQKQRNFPLCWQYIEAALKAQEDPSWLWHRSRDVEFDESATWNWKEEKVERQNIMVPRPRHSSEAQEEEEDIQIPPQSLSPRMPTTSPPINREESSPDSTPRKMEGCKPLATSLVTNEKFSKEDGTPKANAAIYRSIIGSLLYLTASRPDIMYPTSLLSRFMQDPSQVHYGAAKRILRYLQGTRDYGIWYTPESFSKLIGYTDSDWGGSTDDMKSTSGYTFSLGSGIFSWSSKKQDCVAQSSAEAEYVATALTTSQAIWLRRILRYMGEHQENPTEIYCDNKSAIAMAKNPIHHNRTKHIAIKQS
ncbi:hypothetical protein SASPL_157102 [Salvia splendens]|uniref:Retrovirus-related Pol polyprotein from transposon TNT 1-94-like beta-barrel domain-containing protein n=1 Tax=Salvia splendens TaxID=180675 RepID=A0A8X8VVI3_SALSN|nr:hypothetical protein SASPL_157102 [Salvia splendens]